MMFYLQLPFITKSVSFLKFSNMYFLQLYQCGHTNYFELLLETKSQSHYFIFKYAIVTVLSVCTYKLLCNVVAPTALVTSF